MEVNLGDEVKDKIGGFRGVVTAIAKCLTGCDRVSVRGPMTRDGKIGDEYWFDIAAVEVLKKGKVKAESVQESVDKPSRKIGGPPTKSTLK